jgi:hypothetical protein
MVTPRGGEVHLYGVQHDGEGVAPTTCRGNCVGHWPKPCLKRSSTLKASAEKILPVLGAVLSQVRRNILQGEPRSEVGL